MLLIWTRHDSVTEVLAKAAAKFESEVRSSGVFHRAVPPSQAVGSVVGPLLERRFGAVFFFGHGKDEPAHLLGNDGQRAIGVRDKGAFRGRVLCATACHSTVGVGPHVAEAGGSVVGFDGELGVPLVEPYASMFVDAVLTAPRELIRGATAGAAAAASERAFRVLARRLLSGTSIEDHLLGVVMDLNADAASTAGSPSLTAQSQPRSGAPDRCQDS